MLFLWIVPHFLGLNYVSTVCLILLNSSTDGWEEASISDGDEDGEWVDVHHSSDEETSNIVSIQSLCVWVLCGCSSQAVSVYLFRAVSEL